MKSVNSIKASDTLENACKEALAKLEALGDEKQKDLREKLAWCLGNYSHDKNPSGLVEQGKLALKLLQKIKKEKPRQVSQKLIEDLEKSLSNSPYHLIDQAEKGISVRLFDNIVQESGYRKADIAEFIGLDVRTVSNYKIQNKDFSKTDAEHLLKLKELFDKGKEVFGSMKEFSRWLSKPAYGLGNRIPEKLLHYISGIELIKRELIRIEYGDFS